MSSNKDVPLKLVVTSTDKDNVFRVRVSGNSDNHFIIVPEGSTAEIVYRPENSILQVISDIAHNGVFPRICWEFFKILVCHYNITKPGRRDQGMPAGRGRG